MGKKYRQRVLDGTAIAFDMLGEGFIAGTTNSAWHQIGVEGSWKGHFMGSFSLNKSMFSQMITHQSGKETDTPVYYGHPDIYGGDEKASGWIKSLQERTVDNQSTLWANIDWTDNAANQIRSKEFKYISPTIIFNTVDRRSGKMGGASIYSAGLTNQPFLTELPEIRLNSLPYFDISEEIMNEEQIKQLAKMLGLDSMDPDAILVAANQMVNFANHGSAVCSHLNIQSDSDPKDTISNIREMQQPASVSLEDFKALQLKLSQREAVDSIKEAQKAGKVLGNDHPQYKWAYDYAIKDPAGFQAWVSCAPSVVPIGTLPVPNQQKESNPAYAGLSDDAITVQKEINNKFGLTDEDFAKYSKLDDNFSFIANKE